MSDNGATTTQDRSESSAKYKVGDEVLYGGKRWIESEPALKNFNRGLSLIAKFCPPSHYVVVKSFFEEIDDPGRCAVLESAAQQRDRVAVHFLSPWDKVTGELLTGNARADQYYKK